MPLIIDDKQNVFNQKVFVQILLFVLRNCLCGLNATKQQFRTRKLSLSYTLHIASFFSTIFSPVHFRSFFFDKERWFYTGAGAISVFILSC